MYTNLVNDGWTPIDELTLEQNGVMGNEEFKSIVKFEPVDGGFDVDFDMEMSA
jgi:hypothetical protein